MKVTITDAKSVEDQTLCAAMASAFSDYAIPVNLTLPGFLFMMKQRGLTPSASRIAIVDDQIVAIWLVSVRGSAAYLISSGTIPAYRGRGLATQLAHAAFDGLRQSGIESFQTEVLVENKTAVGLYYKLGMTNHRDLSCYTIIGPKTAAGDAPKVKAVQWSDIADITGSFQDWPPSWQNSNASIAAISDTVRCFGTYAGSTLTGYAVLVPDSGRLLQLGVHPDKRRQSIGTALINHALIRSSNEQLGLINVDQADTGLDAFVRSFPCEQTQGQHELHMPL